MMGAFVTFCSMLLQVERGSQLSTQLDMLKTGEYPQVLQNEINVIVIQGETERQICREKDRENT